MSKPGHIKIGALVLALTLLCGGIILLGNTFANNVDYSEGKTAVNVGANQNYDVTLSYYDKEKKDYVTLIDVSGAKAIDAEQNQIRFASSMYWCPGRTEVIYLKVDNNEKFPVSFSLTLNAANANGGSMTDVMSYAVRQNLVPENQPASWAEYKNGISVVPMEDKKAHSLISRKLLESDNSEYDLAVAIHMDESASSIYQEQQISLSFTLQVDSDFEPDHTPTPNP